MTRVHLQTRRNRVLEHARGGTWVKFQDALDRQIEPLGLAAMNTLNPKRVSAFSTSVAVAAKPRSILRAV